MELNPILVAVALVLQLKASAVVGAASGFFFQVEADRFFVTNKHVVAGDPKDPKAPKPDALRLRLHTNAKNIQENDWLEIPLFGPDGGRKWKEHVLSVVDVAMIPLEGVDLSRFVLQWLRPANFPPDEMALHPGEDVFVLGYPRGFSDGTHNLPIARNAFMASTFGVPFQGEPLFLTDARLHPGTSGSPVFTKPKGAWVGKDGRTRLVSGPFPYYLLGIHSGSLKPLPGQDEPLGLGAAWYACLLQEIVAGKLSGKCPF